MPTFLWWMTTTPAFRSSWDNPETFGRLQLYGAPHSRLTGEYLWISIMITYSTYLGWIKVLCRWISILARPQRLLIIKEKDETAKIEAVHKDPSSRKTIQDDRGIEYHASVVSEVFFFCWENPQTSNSPTQTINFNTLSPCGHGAQPCEASCRMFPKRWMLRVWWMLSPQRTGLGETRFFLGGGERSFVFFGWLENCWFSKPIYIYLFIYKKIIFYIHVFIYTQNTIYITYTYMNTCI